MLVTITEMEKKQLAANPVACIFKPQEETEDATTKTVDYLLTPDAETSNKIKKECNVFKTGKPEMFLKWLIEHDDLCKQAKATALELQMQHFKTLLGGSAEEIFNLKFQERTAERVATATGTGENVVYTITEEKVFKNAINDLKLHFFSPYGGIHACRHQVNCMRHNLQMEKFFSRTFKLQDCSARLEKLNECLKCFPEDPEGNAMAPKSLTVQEMVDIVDRAKPTAWTVEMLGATIDTYKMTYLEVVNYFKRLELKCKIMGGSPDADDTARIPKKRKRKNVSDEDSKKIRDLKYQLSLLQTGNASSKKEKPKMHECPHCHKMGAHSADDCDFNPKNASKKPKFQKGRSDNSKSERTFSIKQALAIGKAMVASTQKKTPGKSKRKRTRETDEEKAYLAAMKKHDAESESDSSDSESDDDSEQE